MSPLVLALLAAVSLGAFGFAFAPALFGSNRAQRRREALRGDLQTNRRVARAESVRDNRRKSVQEAIKAQNQARNAKKRVTLKQLLFQANMKITPRAFVRNSAIVGIAVFASCYVLQVPLLFAFVFGVAGGYLLPRFYVSRKRKSFQKKFLDELPNAVEAIVRGVKSGLPLNDSIRIVAQEVNEPCRSEFARVLDQQSVGKAMHEAVGVLYDRVPLSEVNFFVVVITVQQQSGGNLSEALGNLARVLRNRKKMQAKIKAMSSEAKASAMIIGGLPFIVAGLVSLVSPAYLTPLYTTTIGYVWLGVAACLMALGGFVMRRMVQFEV